MFPVIALHLELIGLDECVSGKYHCSESRSVTSILGDDFPVCKYDGLRHFWVSVQPQGIPCRISPSPVASHSDGDGYAFDVVCFRKAGTSQSYRLMKPRTSSKPKIGLMLSIFHPGLPLPLPQNSTMETRDVATCPLILNIGGRGEIIFAVRKKGSSL
ncbi:hypothetical protein P170DRAFT_54586 [Aspergillus steynii IBT 23096]|uniref:Uncharacterized protein n=1 Tax=Aspergillus steynii IBT 23096 TaxID=1392250 RepID=A0A2I2FSB0_9EURO|nr:uncharacterized protein P170DRAFT_54586 [Aspergillus steynii IBT 23096]PLB43520.1 hypothetical protein P170DRAFT_54586 [Aspergillus steynii IBT 23096]